MSVFDQKLFERDRNHALSLAERNLIRIITQESESSQIWDLCRQKANNKNFYIISNSEMDNDTIFRKAKKT